MVCLHSWLLIMVCRQRTSPAGDLIPCPVFVNHKQALICFACLRFIRLIDCPSVRPNTIVPVTVPTLQTTNAVSIKRGEHVINVSVIKRILISFKKILLLFLLLTTFSQNNYQAVSSIFCWHFAFNATTHLVRCHKHNLEIDQP